MGMLACHKCAVLVGALFVGLAAALPADQCSVPDDQRKDCGFVGIDQGQCEQKGCCWKPAARNNVNDVPWCFYKGSPGPSPPPPAPSSCPLNYTYASQDSPFTAADEKTLLKYFLANTDIDGKGGVVASPDHDTPGGSYYYAWERDGALSMATMLSVAEFDADISTRFEHYTQWVLRVQSEADPHGIDVRAEPKYMLPDGKVFDGSWCRPQTDGPALRARTLIKYAAQLGKVGKSDAVKAYLWTGDANKYNGGAIKYDLDWVASNWKQNGCDLWEEIQSDDFFWNRFMFRAALKMGAQFATSMGDSQSASRYSGAAAELDTAIKSHYNGNFVFETSSRQKDAAVFEALNHGYLNDGVMSPSSTEVAGTVSTLVDLFCTQYSINGADSTNGVPGVLIGRYDGDHYAGGNPWHLLTASLARLLYRGASEVMQAHNSNSSLAGVESWQQLLGVPQEGQLSAVADAMAGAADGVMIRLKKHINGNNANLHCNEQLDRNTGVPLGAKDLTWSYANVLSAIDARKQYVASSSAASV